MDDFWKDPMEDRIRRALLARLEQSPTEQAQAVTQPDPFEMGDAVASARSPEDDRVYSRAALEAGDIHARHPGRKPKPPGKALMILSMLPGIIGRGARAVGEYRHAKHGDWMTEQAAAGKAEADRQDDLMEAIAAMSGVDPAATKELYRRGLSGGKEDPFDVALRSPEEIQRMKDEQELRELFATERGKAGADTLDEGLGTLRGERGGVRVPPMSAEQARLLAGGSLDPTETFQSGYGQFIPGMEGVKFPAYESPEEKETREREAKFTTERGMTPILAERERLGAMATSGIPQRPSASGTEPGANFTRLPRSVQFVYENMLSDAEQSGAHPDPADERKLRNHVVTQYGQFLAGGKVVPPGLPPWQARMWTQFKQMEGRGDEEWAQVMAEAMAKSAARRDQPSGQ